MSGQHIVLMSCGHWFREPASVDTIWPSPGKPRVCGHPEHYPDQYPAIYLDGIDLIPLGGRFAR